MSEAKLTVCLLCKGDCKAKNQLGQFAVYSFHATPYFTPLKRIILAVKSNVQSSNNSMVCSKSTHEEAHNNNDVIMHSCRLLQCTVEHASYWTPGRPQSSTD